MYISPSLRNEYISKVIDKFTSAGYTLTFDDVKKCIEKRIEILDFYKYDIKVNDDLVMLCMNMRYYPDYFNNYDLSTELTRGLFLMTDYLPNIQRFKKIKYDIECLRNACTIKDNSKVIHFLIEQGIMPDEKCVINLIDAYEITELKEIYSLLK
jgi:hypothetical protein